MDLVILTYSWLLNFQVPLFQHMDSLVLENICDRVKSLIFTKGETVSSALESDMNLSATKPFDSVDLNLIIADIKGNTDIKLVINLGI